MFVFDVRAVDTDSDSYDGRPPQKNLDQHERRQKGKYLEVFLER